MPIKISIPGGNGRMGRTLIKEIINSNNLELSNSSCLPNEKEIGLDLGTLVGINPINKKLTDNSLSIFENTDVIIDFTVPEATIFHVEKASFYNIPIVIGTTGFSKVEFHKIKSFRQIMKCDFQSCGELLTFHACKLLLVRAPTVGMVPTTTFG